MNIRDAKQEIKNAHNEDIARGFAGYLRLYAKYGAVYSIPEILDGSADTGPFIAMVGKHLSMNASQW